MSVRLSTTADLQAEAADRYDVLESLIAARVAVLDKSPLFTTKAAP